MPGVPHEVIIKAGIFGEHTLGAPVGFEVGRVVAIELPFARDAGLISGIAHHVTKRDFARWQHPERLPVSKIVLARHELHTSGRAERLSVGVVKSNAAAGQLIESRSLVRSPAIAAEAFVAEVVRHDQHDVGFSCRRRWSINAASATTGRKHPQHRARTPKKISSGRSLHRA